MNARDVFDRILETLDEKKGSEPLSLDVSSLPTKEITSLKQRLSSMKYHHWAENSLLSPVTLKSNFDREEGVLVLWLEPGHYSKGRASKSLPIKEVRGGRQ